MSTIAETVSQGRVAQSLRHLIDEAERLLAGAAESGDEKLAALRQNSALRLQQLRLDIDALEDTAAYQARRAVRETRRAVQAHPFEAIGMAAAAGLLAAALVVLLARRH